MISNEQNTFLCSYEGCTERYSREEDLKQHETSVHQQTCTHCPQPYCKFSCIPQSSFLEEHIKKEHGGQLNVESDTGINSKAKDKSQSDGTSSSINQKEYPHPTHTNLNSYTSPIPPVHTSVSPIRYTSTSVHNRTSQNIPRSHPPMVLSAEQLADMTNLTERSNSNSMGNSFSSDIAGNKGEDEDAYTWE